jgi:hypothetical protein
MCVLGMHFTVSSNGMSFQQRKLYRKGIRQRNAHPKRTTKTNKGNPWIVGLFQLTIQSVTRLVSAHHIPSKLSSFPVCFPHFKWSTYIQNKIEGRDRGGGGASLVCVCYLCVFIVSLMVCRVQWILVRDGYKY